MTHDQLLELTPLYALDALTTEEARELEAHLGDCSACQAELDEYFSTMASLTPDEPAPQGVWDRIVDAIDTEEAAAPVTDLAERRSSRAWTWVTGLAAAAALVFGGLLLTNVINDSLLQESTLVSAAEEAAATADSIVADFIVNDSSVAQIILTSTGQGFVVPTDDLDPLDSSRTYQLWVINTDQQAISAGALGHDPSVSTFTWTGDVTGFALTREVAGGVVSSEGDVVSVIEGF